MIKKFNFAALVIAVSLMTVSCSQQDDGIDTGVTEKTATFKVSIKKTGASTRADGGAEPGIGDENKIGDNWVAFAKKGTHYKAFPSTEANGSNATQDGNGYNNVAKLDSVSAISRIYVIANPYEMTSEGIAWTDFIRPENNIEEVEITELVSKHPKSLINTFSTALQNAVIDNSTTPVPNFGTSRMLMSGRALPPPDAESNSQTGPVEVRVSLEREFSKVELIVNSTPGPNLAPGGSSPATLVSINKVTSHRVKPAIYPFKTHVSSGPDMDDTNYYRPEAGSFNINNNTPTRNSTTYSYTYDFTTPPEVNTTNGKAYLYVTPNKGNVEGNATQLLVHATLSADFFGNGVEEQERKFKLYIADPDVLRWATEKNTIYKITGTINSWGEATAESALDGNADLDVKVELKDWSVRNVQIDFE